MRWAIRHRTAYRYASAVRDSFNEARVRPPSDRQQRLENFQLTVNPAVPVNHYTDFYGNWVDHFDVAEPHTALELETRAGGDHLRARPPGAGRPARHAGGGAPGGARRAVL